MYNKYYTGGHQSSNFKCCANEDCNTKPILNVVRHGATTTSSIKKNQYYFTNNISCSMTSYFKQTM